MNENIHLSDAQIAELARALVPILTFYFDEAENEQKFQQWLKEKRGGKSDDI